MPLLTLTQVAIEFVGLVMVTTQSQPVRALIPRVPMAQVQTDDHTEHHSALIAFPKAAVLYCNWAGRKPLGASSNSTTAYDQIDLNGDKVVFDTLGTPDGVPSPTTIALPRLQNPTSTDLTTPFKPPSFSGAAGVIEIPKGTLLACQGKNDRIDALLKLNTAGTIVIRTLDGTKQVILDATKFGDDRIYVANVPDNYANTGGLAAPITDHWHVYYMMTTNPNGSVRPIASPPGLACVEPLLTQGGGSNNRDPRMERVRAVPQAFVIPQQKTPVRVTSSTQTARIGTAPQVDPYVITAECGSTQWP